MPVKSEAQRRLMFAALKDPKATGIPRNVAEKFVGPEAHKEPQMKKPLPAFMMKKDDKKKDGKKPAKANPFAKGKPFAKGGGIESKGKTKAC